MAYPRDNPIIKKINHVELRAFNLYGGKTCGLDWMGGAAALKILLERKHPLRFKR